LGNTEKSSFHGGFFLPLNLKEGDSPPPISGISSYRKTWIDVKYTKTKMYEENAVC